MLHCIIIYVYFATNDDSLTNDILKKALLAAKQKTYHLLFTGSKLLTCFSRGTLLFERLEINWQHTMLPIDSGVGVLQKRQHQSAMRNITITSKRWTASHMPISGLWDTVHLIFKILHLVRYV
jgi:hypothetical protein